MPTTGEEMERNHGIKQVALNGQAEANILTAAIAPWVFQHNIDIYSQEFKDAVQKLVDCRDQVFTFVNEHYEREGLV